MPSRRASAVTRTELAKHLETLATKKDLEAFATKVDLEDLRGEVRAVGVVVERIESNVRLVAEGLVATREQLERKIDDVERRLSSRIDVLEEVVRKSSRDVAELRAEVADMRRQLVRREPLDQLEERVAEVERRVGIVRK